MSDLVAQLQSALRGAYRLERELGGGGMSRVFVAEETALGRKVVLKVLPPELAASLSIDRFRREIQLAASLHHPNIVPLLTAGEADGLLYYTMPLIDGDSLRTRLAREGELPVGETIRLLRDVVDALACAHERGVVHRDIKPDNVLLSRHHALVTDFGVAKALSEATGRSSLTSAGVALGTPAYMAPEQATADPHVDHRADIYAVGATAYEMLAGRPPFLAPTPQGVLAAQVTQAAEPVTRFRPSVPPALAALVMRCLEKRAADRWQSADELLHQLEAMATPSGGMAPTGAVAAVSDGTAPTAVATAAPARRSHRAGYLVLGLALALAVAWGVSRYRGARPEPETAAGPQTVAVLPFENLGRAEDAYFADGITEEIGNRLTGLSGLRVIARSSAKQYKGTTKPLRQIGEELGAAYVLEGTVRWEKAGDTTSRIRVSPELIRVSDGTSVWAHGYDAVMSGVFSVQSEIAEQVAGALNVALAAPEREALGARPTANSQAYDLYLQGHSYFQRGYGERNLKSAETLLRQAIELDSSFAMAWAELAQVHDFTYWFYYDRTDQRLELARAAAERALQLQPGLPEGHLALGYYYYHGHLDYPKALAEVDLARRARPHDAEILQLLAFIQRRQARWDEAYENLAQAVALDPRSGKVYAEAAWTALALGRYAEAESLIRRGLAVAPDEPQSYTNLAALRLARDGDLAGMRQAVIDGAKAADKLAIVQWISLAGLSDAVTLGLSPAELGQLLSVTPEAGDSADYYRLRADVSARQRQEVEQRAYLDSARRVLEGRLLIRPREHIWHASLGLVLAGLGRKADALREGGLAEGLMPPSKDAADGSVVLYAVARIQATVGENGAALDRLERLLAAPRFPPVSAAWLRVDPFWAPLRADPRFQRLTAGK